MNKNPEKVENILPIKGKLPDKSKLAFKHCVHEVYKDSIRLWWNFWPHNEKGNEHAHIFSLSLGLD